MYWFQTLHVLFLAAPAVQAVSQQFPGIALDKRDACYIDAYGVAYTCDTGYACCGSVIAECIPEDAVCCDTGDQIGYCDTGLTCGFDTNDDVLVCLNSNSAVAAPVQTATQTYAPVSTTAATTTSQTHAPVATVAPTPTPTKSESIVTLKVGVSVLLTFQLVSGLLLW